jgi:long-subunit acyl-CoA synthetase (AMP-forming)
VPATLIRRTVKTVGCGTTILFGQTEMHGGVISQTKLTDSPQDQAETVGQPLPDLEVKIADLVPGDAPGKVQKFVLRDRLSAGVLPIESAQEVLS